MKFNGLISVLLEKYINSVYKNCIKIFNILIEYNDDMQLINFISRAMEDQISREELLIEIIDDYCIERFKK